MSDFDTNTDVTDEDEFAPDFDPAGNDDDMVIDFSGVEAMGGFEALPAGWYLASISDFSDTETKNPGKLPVGTPGTNWEFTIQEGKFENRKQWTNHWHHPRTFGFMKGMLVCLDEFNEEELEGQFSLRDRQRAVGQLILIRLARRKYNGEWTNDIKAFRHHEDRDGIELGGDSDSGDDLSPR